MGLPTLRFAPPLVTASGGALRLRVVVCSASVLDHGGGRISILSGGAGRIRTDVSGEGVPFQGDWV